MSVVSGVLVGTNIGFCKGSLADRVALAVTDNPYKKKKIVVNYKLMPWKFATQIQLCPWFLDWLMEKEYKMHRDVMRTNVGKYFIDGATKEKGRFGFRQIGTCFLLLA